MAEAEHIEATDDELDDEFAQVAEQLKISPDEVRKRFDDSDQMAAVRADIRRRKALDWLVEHVEIVDEDGEPIDRADLEAPDDEADGPGRG